MALVIRRYQVIEAGISPTDLITQLPAGSAATVLGFEPFAEIDIEVEGTVTNVRDDLDTLMTSKGYTFISEAPASALDDEVADGNTVGNLLMNSTTELNLGAVADGEFFRRNGTDIVGANNNPQLLFGNNAVAATTADKFLNPGADSDAAGTVEVQMPVTRAGIIRNMYLIQSGAGNGNVIVWTMRLNGISQTLAVTLASTGTSASNTADSFSVVAGDLLSLIVTKALAVGASPNDPLVTVEFASA